ncbi:hypothetical protein [Rufibacter hautae]|uniref:Uncharacterized protein n=1 Tax=Rufibacter hautae TaxID=2595005 RepID=A0A5B6TA41_9BACT|nr:hypothetical protein [Rufibacter hautae]KAA3436747.1 hypothetical protein FOA19_20425 [Rufibacter hautae]
MEQNKLLIQYPQIPALHNKGDVFLALPESFMFQKNGKELVFEISQVLDEGLVAVNIVTAVDEYQNVVVSYFSSAEPMAVNELTVLLIYMDVNSNLLRPLTVLVNIFEITKEPATPVGEPGGYQYFLPFNNWNDSATP